MSISHIEGTVFALDLSSAFESGGRAKLPTKPKPDSSNTSITNDYAPWGACGYLPTAWRLKLEQSTIAAQAFDKVAKIIYGKGMGYYKDIVKDGEVIGRKWLYDERIEEWLERNNINTYLLSRLFDYTRHGNVSSEFILNQNRSQILSLRHLDVEMCRLGRLNRNGIIEKVGYSPLWRQGYEPSKDQIIDIEKLDPFNYESQMRNGTRGKFAVWSKIPYGGRIYYAYPPWGGMFKDDGWVDVGNKVPKLISYLQDNIIKIRYVIRVSIEVWEKWFPEWDSYTAEQKFNKADKKKKEITELLVGNGNDPMAIRTILSTSYRNPINGNLDPGITVEAVDDKIKKDEWIPNSQAADAQIVQTVGLDPSEAGLQPQGGKMGAGSGSDKRVSRLNTIGLNATTEEIIFEPLRMVKKYNGWDKGIKFAFKHQLPTTLDRNKSGVTEDLNEME